MATVFEVQEADARKLLKELDHGNAGTVKLAKLQDLLVQEVDNTDDDEISDDMTSKSRKILQKAIAAVAAEKKIKIISSNGHADADDEDEAPAKKGRTKKAPAKKAKAKKKVEEDDDEEEEDEPKAKKKKAPRKRSSSEPTAKDRIFDIWVKDPVKFKKTIDKTIAKFKGRATAATIRKWTGRWSKLPMGVGYPMGADGRESEIKKALKMIKNAG